MSNTGDYMPDYKPQPKDQEKYMGYCWQCKKDTRTNHIGGCSECGEDGPAPYQEGKEQEKAATDEDLKSRTDKATEQWKDVKDVDKWLRELRGYDEAESSPEEGREPRWTEIDEESLNHIQELLSENYHRGYIFQSYPVIEFFLKRESKLRAEIKEKEGFIGLLKSDIEEYIDWVKKNDDSINSLLRPLKCVHAPLCESSECGVLCKKKSEILSQIEAIKEENKTLKLRDADSLKEIGDLIEQNQSFYNEISSLKHSLEQAQQEREEYAERFVKIAVTSTIESMMDYLKNETEILSPDGSVSYGTDCLIEKRKDSQKRLIDYVWSALAKKGIKITNPEYLKSLTPNNDKHGDRSKY